MKKRSDPDRVWLKRHASDEEFLEAFRSYAETQWGLPDFGTIRRIIEVRRARGGQAAAAYLPI